ncbi:MAG TPA: mannose-6-phosphate isomerase, class I [Galbitalea sp.]|nr:mannose-6-phosphate isomerase, class I [Galbitalea sp.]
MFVGLTNTPRDYAWGSKTAMAEMLGHPPSGGAEAELWFGAHPGSPSRLIDGPGGAKTIDQITDLPFIMKVLAAQSPLSLQAHPTTLLAMEGFDRENAAGIALDDPRRNYKDARAKPELIYAIRDGFEALCGFRPAAATRELLGELGPDPLVADLIHRLADDRAIRDVFEWLISNGTGVPELRARILELAPAVDRPEFATVHRLGQLFPGDVGILISLLLNLVTLRAGEVVYLPAGNIHSYQRGLGIEVLAASDNVLRGGLTPKHVDVPELLSVLDFRPLPVAFLTPEATSAGVLVFRPDVPDFELTVVAPGDRTTVSLAPAGEFIALCTAGVARLEGATSVTRLRRGGATFGTADESPVSVSGDSTLFFASRNSGAQA